ncbi:MAG: 50S ribosomal protein L31 [Candidatus Melainabacteria bacterium]|nr:50S ribosomal protein L31 [Candidatus Melainabacteria bacterium]
MKEGIHPKYNKIIAVCTNCGHEFETGSVLTELRLEICHKCHPVFLGNNERRILDTEGRVQKFEKKFANFTPQSGSKKK